MDFLTLPFTTDFSSIAFSVLAILLGCSVIVWITLFMKFFNLIRVKLLQARALKLLKNTPVSYTHLTLPTILLV